MKTRLAHYGYVSFMSFFVFIIAYSLKKGDGHYIFDSISFIVLITVFYLFYERLNFNSLIFLFLGIVMVLHDLGRFGAFNLNIWIFPWDTITHFFSSFVITMAFFKIVGKVDMSTGWRTFIVFIATLGIATLGEIVEFVGAIKTPDGQGILGVEARGTPIAWLGPDYWDTMKDLVFNAAGSLLGLVIWHLERAAKSHISR